MMTSDELVAIGQQLRIAREQRGQSLDEVAQSTKIRRKFLEGFEFGELDPSLTDLQVRGFLRNYATYLQLDLEAMLWAYRQANIDSAKPRTGIFRRVTPTPTSPMPTIPLRASSDSHTPPRGIPRVDRPLKPTTDPYASVDVPSGGSRWWIMLGGIILLVGGVLAGVFVLRPVEDSTAGNNATIAPMQIEGGATLAPTRTPDPKGEVEILYTATPTQEASGVIVAPPTVNMTGAQQVSLALEAIQRSFVRIAVDGVVEYEGILSPGTPLEYRGRESITLRTSNAAGLNVMVNNQNLGSLGGRGELYEETYTLEGIPMPRPIVSSTPTSEGLPPIDESRPEPILPIIPNSALTAEAVSTIQAQNNLPTPLPIPELLVTEEAAP